jgi:hypothetical protein
VKPASEHSGYVTCWRISTGRQDSTKVTVATLAAVLNGDVAALAAELGEDFVAAIQQRAALEASKARRADAATLALVGEVVDRTDDIPAESWNRLLTDLNDPNLRDSADTC